IRGSLAATPNRIAFAWTLPRSMPGPPQSGQNMIYQDPDAPFEPAPSFRARSKLHDEPRQEIEARDDALHLGIFIRRVDLTSDDTKPVQRRFAHTGCEAHIGCPSAA